jgi:nucleotide-binding universal stress UspA family protein
MRILLAVDLSSYSQAALEAVLSQFMPATTEVRVFHAVNWEQHLPMSYRFAEGPDAAKGVLSLRDRMLHDADTYANGMAARLRAAGFTVDTEVRPEGDPRSAIVEAAETWRADLIVMGSHGRSGLDRFLLGSVSERVARHAPCSVEIIRPPAQRPAAPAPR